MGKLLKTALILGIVPFVVGIAIFISWILTNEEWLEMAGLFTIYGGTAAVAIGTICLIIHVCMYWKSSLVNHKRLLWQATGILGLYIGNFVVAGGIVFGVVDLIGSRFTVTIVNQSNDTLKDAQIIAGSGCSNQTIGDVSPGNTVTKSFCPKEGAIIFKGIHQSKTIEILIDPYYSSPRFDSNKQTVIIHSDSKADVEEDQVTGRK